MSDFKERQDRVLDIRNQRDAADDQLRRTNSELQAVARELDALRRRAGPNDAGRIQELVGQQDRLKDALASDAKQLSRQKELAQAAQRDLFALAPQQLIEQLDDSLPFLLFPIRIETKFMTVENRRELWVRIFPDAISNFTHEDELTADEIQAGENYWTGRWTNRGKTQAEQDNDHRGLWNVVANRFGAERAAWVIRQTKPTNWQDDLNAIPPLVFPVHATAKPQAWTRAPHTRGLPDRFVVSTYSGNQKIDEIVGAHILDQLALGPDPLQIEEQLKHKADGSGEIAVAEEIAWMFDFEKAESVGMAVRIPLRPPYDTDGFDLVVLGLRLSTDARQSRLLLEELIDNHHFANEGISFVPQGTPTNNTESAGSGFDTLDTANEDSFAVETGKQLFVPIADYFDKADGQRLAEACGINPSVFYHIKHSDGVDVKEALAMNTALWAGTWGLYLKRWMAPLFSDAAIGFTQEFFTEFVTGRGLLPAIRVGNQPYGVLVTSSFARWKWSANEIDQRNQYWDNLKEILKQLQEQWETFRKTNVAYAGKSDDFQNLLSVIGLLASAAEYYSRKAVSDINTWNYLSFGGYAGWMDLFWVNLQLTKARMLKSIGLGSEPHPFIRKLTFLSALESLHESPVIDGDPKIPLSETDPIRPFDATDNYIDWLLKSSWDTITSEDFKDRDGKTIPPPRALLYKLLHRAYTESFNSSIARFLLNQNLISEWPETRELENIGGKQHLTELDYQNVDAAKITVADAPLANKKTSLADHMQNRLAAQVVPFNEAIPLLPVRRALETLRKCPTARLERLFAEHLDLCSYRLDAWQAAMFSRRLQLLRRGQEDDLPFRTGIYLGAFGWVENLKPAGPKRVVPFDTLPSPLRKPEQGAVLEDPENEGYIHGPSMSHAVTAAVLRNAYRAHHNQETMAVNLSSERVRTALSYLEGLRNNQDLAALLGYQFERGLHENFPIDLGLDAIVYQFRDKFPLISKKLTPVPGGTPIEVVEARNVVNGYDLLQTVHANADRFPYSTLNPVPTLDQQKAIDAEINRLADALDAVGDLTLSESVFQVVQGNYERAAGTLQALGEAKMPPEPEIVQTPRSGQAITIRVVVNLDVAKITGWAPAIPLTPRAAAGPALNHWLRERLPPPQDIEVAVTWLNPAPQFISFDQLGLQPIDIVLLSGNQAGDNSSELERFIVHHFRKAKSIADNVGTCFYQKPDPAIPDNQAVVFNPKRASTPAKTPLYQLLPLLRALRAVVSECRPLSAQDYMLSTEAQKVSTGYNEASPNLNGTFTRVKAARDALALVVDNLKLLVEGTLQPAFEALLADPAHVIVPAWQARLDNTRTILRDLHRFGFPEALPASVTSFTFAEIDTLVPQAEAVLRLAQKRIADADKLRVVLVLPPVPAGAAEAEKKKIELERKRKLNEALSNYTQAAKLLLGKSFPLLPSYKFRPENAAELSLALAGVNDLFAPGEEKDLIVEDWLQGIARIRAPMQTLENVAVFNDLLTATSFDLTPVQLPFKAGERWIGVEFKNQSREDKVSVVMHQPPANVFAEQCGLLIDEWTEVIPTDKETTGIAFHFNRPNAMPPQTLLLAVTPELKGKWTWDDLMDILRDTLARAKRRAVDPEMIDGSVKPDSRQPESNYFQVLPAVLHDFTNYNFRGLLTRDAIAPTSLVRK